MKTSPPKLRRFLAYLIGTWFYTVSAPFAGAGEVLKDVSKEISNLRKHIVSAEVWLVPRNTESRAEIMEADIPEAACPYQAIEQKDLDALMNVLVSAGIAEAASPEPDDVRIAIYLQTDTGTVIKLLTGPDYSNGPARGLYNRDVPIAIKSGFETAMRAWASQRQSTKTTLRCQKK